VAGAVLAQVRGCHRFCRCSHFNLLCYTSIASGMVWILIKSKRYTAIMNVITIFVLPSLLGGFKQEGVDKSGIYLYLK